MPEIVPLLGFSRIRALGDAADLNSEEWSRDSRVEMYDYREPIFSVGEQLGGPRWFAKTDVAWIPQYNIPLLYRGRLVVTIHDICQLAVPESLGNSVQRWYARYLLTNVAKRADGILCDSEFTRSEVSRYLKIDSTRLAVAYPGVGLNPTGKMKVATENNLRGSYLLTVGNVKKHKNLKRLIEAFGRVRDRIPHDLVIVGKREGFLNSEMELSNVPALMQGRIRFTGHVSDEELRSHYQHASALVFPSFYEGFGFPLVEAMAQGCPVVCSNAASLPEVAGDAALLFNPFSIEEMAEALVAIATNAELRERLVLAGRRRCRAFDARVCAKQTVEVIHTAAGW